MFDGVIIDAIKSIKEGIAILELQLEEIKSEEEETNK